MSSPILDSAPAKAACDFSAGDVRFESTFEMDEPLLREVVSARDRSLNKRDGLVFAIVFLIVLAAYIWGTVSVWDLTPWGIFLGLIIIFLLGYSVLLAVKGFTVFWPARSWRKTWSHWFSRHGAPVSDSPRCTIRTSACTTEVRTSVLVDGKVSGTISKPYSAFSHLEETEHLVVMVNGEVEVGNLLHNMVSSDYAQKLEQRADLEDMIWDKNHLQGGTPAQLKDYLERKLGHRA